MSPAPQPPQQHYYPSSHMVAHQPTPTYVMVQPQLMMPTAATLPYVLPPISTRGGGGGGAVHWWPEHNSTPSTSFHNHNHHHNHQSFRPLLPPPGAPPERGHITAAAYHPSPPFRKRK